MIEVINAFLNGCRCVIEFIMSLIENKLED